MEDQWAAFWGRGTIMRIGRRGFLKTAVGAPALLAAQPSQPNVLFVLADEWRAQALGYSGDPNVRTAALDRFAAESVNFENAVSGHPVCCPYRGSLMTGQYPLTNGLFVNDEELKPTGTTLGQAFAQAGYQTGYIGKWHVYGSPDGKYGRRLAYIPPDHRFGFQYWKACECTHDYNHSLYYEGDDPEPKYWPGYDAIAQTDDACRFIEQQSKKRDPFFLVLSLGPPHFPVNTAPERYQALYREREIQLRPNVPEEYREQATRDLRGYYSHMAALDDCVGRLLAALHSAGIAERTIVVFTSDHGDMMRSQGLSTKHVPWDESIRIPFLLRYPQKLGTKGKRIRTVLNTPDIFPTLAALAGLRTPGGVQGTDYSKLCQGAAPARDSAAFLQFPVSYGAARSEGIAEYRGLRTEQHTYVRSIRGPWLLYDNQADPFQMHNLCGRSEHKDLQARLDRALDARLKTLHDDFLPAAEYISRAGIGHNREINSTPRHVVSPWGDWESTM
jgi:arylsulfatase A-like enzyme